MGNHLRITKGPHRYLETPYGALPLFVVPDPGSQDYEEDGFVGEERIELTEPALHGDQDDDEDEASPNETALQLATEETPVLPVT
jgi:hypothetical protein